MTGSGPMVASMSTQSTKRGRKPKYIHTIILTDINARAIYNKYKSNPDDLINDVKFSSIIEYNKKDLGNSDITDIAAKNIAPAILTDNKSITMIDYVNFGCLANRTDLRCFHDHHQFDTCPIGLPIKYICRKKDKNCDELPVITGVNDYFLTFGVFCSFPCLLGYLEEHKHVPLFRNSKQLLYSMYYKLYQSELSITAAPSWEILKDYGGVPTVDINNFRDNYCACNYQITENIKRPYMVSVGKYVEQRRCGLI